MAVVFAPVDQLNVPVQFVAVSVALPPEHIVAFVTFILGDGAHVIVANALAPSQLFVVQVA